MKLVSSSKLKHMKIDAHDVKKEILGKESKDISKYNIAIDGDGYVVLVPNKPGSLPNVHSGQLLTDFIN